MMDPRTLLTFPTPFDPSKQYFSIADYQLADSTVNACKCRIDSSRNRDQRVSMVSTNMIVYLLNDFLRRTILGIPNYPKIDAQPDAVTVQKVEQVFQRFMPQCSQDLGTGPKREDRIEHWSRSLNIFRAFFSAEIAYLAKFLQKTKGLPTKEGMAYLCINCPGSLADAVGCTETRYFEEKIAMLDQQLFEAMCSSKLTGQEIMALTEQVIHNATQ